MSALRLFICPTSPAFKALYTTAADAYNTTPYEQRNSGFDLFIDATDVVPLAENRGVLVGHGCKAVAIPEGDGLMEYWTPPMTRAFWLAPRSSISATPWTLANSMGLIDGTYRGPIRAALKGSTIEAIAAWNQKRLTQLSAADLLPWAEVVVVDELPGHATVRGEGGFGSSGVGV